MQHLFVVRYIGLALQARPSLLATSTAPGCSAHRDSVIPLSAVVVVHRLEKLFFVSECTEDPYKGAQKLQAKVIGAQLPVTACLLSRHCPDFAGKGPSRPRA